MLKTFITKNQTTILVALKAMATALAFNFSAQATYFDDLKASQQASNPLVEWQHIGPGMSGYIDKFWIHPTDPNAMFMDLDMGNQHGTWDGGAWWRSIRDSDGTDSNVAGLTVMNFSHQNPDFGLLMAKDGVYETLDRGRSWQFVVDANKNNSEKHNVLSVDPNNDNVWYAGAGQSWMIKFTHFTKNGIVYNSDVNHSEGYILKSSNKGRDWTELRNGIPADADFSNVIVDPRNSDIVYASSQYGIYKSINAGNSWSLVNQDIMPHMMTRDMGSFYDKNNPSEFYLYALLATDYELDTTNKTVNTTGGVYRSSDGGETWENLTGNLAIDMSQIDTWGYRERYYRTIANWNGITIAEAKEYIIPTSVFSQFIGMEVDPTNKERVYLVHNFKHDYSFPPGNIWMRRPDGTWIAAAREGQYWINEVNKSYWESRNQPLGMNTTFAHVQREHTENDNTQTGPRFIEVASNGDAFTAFAQQVMRSTDDGATWQQVDDYETSPGSGHWVGRGDSNLPGESIQVNTGRPGEVLFGSGEHGLWRNTDDGELVAPGKIAVEQLAGQSHADDDPTSTAAIAVHPNDPNTIYTMHFRQSKRGDLRRSTDNGKTWVTVSTPLNFPNASDVIKHYSLLIDYQTPDNMYFTVPIDVLDHHTSTMWKANGPSGFNEYGIYKSTDGGVTWNRGNNGIAADKSIYRLTMDPVNPNILYAASNQKADLSDGGLYKTIDGGANWQSMNLPTGVVSVNKLSIGQQTGAIFIATGSYKKDSGIGGVYKSVDDGNNWQLVFDMPYVRNVSVSPLDENIIGVINGPAQTLGRKNPGAYITVDGAITWHKINHNHGQAGRINEFEADPYDVNTFWGSLYGTGFWKIDLSPLIMQIPGKIESEHFSAFNDLTTENSLGAYREDGVEIANTFDTGGGYHIVSAPSDDTNKEWLEYTINVKETANYQVSARLASVTDNNRFKYFIDGVKVGSDVTPESTGSENTWEDIATNIGEVSQGSHVFKVQFNTGELNINRFTFTTIVVTEPEPDFDKDGTPDATDPDDDNDGLSDIEEDNLGTSPKKKDSDDDGVNDKEDYFPLVSTETIDTDEDGTGDNADLDDDNDGLSDIEEDNLGTNPKKKDSDDDGVNDKEDYFPLDALKASKPTTPDPTPETPEPEVIAKESSGGSMPTSLLIMMFVFYIKRVFCEK